MKWQSLLEDPVTHPQTTKQCSQQAHFRYVPQRMQSKKFTTLLRIRVPKEMPVGSEEGRTESNLNEVGSPQFENGRLL